MGRTQKGGLPQASQVVTAGIDDPMRLMSSEQAQGTRPAPQVLLPVFLRAAGQPSRPEAGRVWPGPLINKDEKQSEWRLPPTKTPQNDVPGSGKHQKWERTAVKARWTHLAQLPPDERRSF